MKKLIILASVLLFTVCAQAQVRGMGKEPTKIKTGLYTPKFNINTKWYGEAPYSKEHYYHYPSLQANVDAVNRDYARRAWIVKINKKLTPTTKAKQLKVINKTKDADVAYVRKTYN